MKTKPSAQLALAVVALCGCRPVSTFEPTVPAEVDVATIVVVHEDGMVTGGEFSPWTEDEALPLVTSQDGMTFVLGFDTSLQPELHAAGIERLELATRLQPLMPEPAWVGRWPVDGTLETASVDELPPLTPITRNQTCPAPNLENVLVDAQCRERRCGVQAEVLGPCALRMTFPFCDIGTVDAVSDFDGTVRLQFGDGGWSCEQAPTDPLADATALCTQPQNCRLQVYTGATDVPERFTQDTLQLVSGGPYIPENLNIISTLFSRLIRHGYAFDFTLLDDRAVVALGSGDQPEGPCVNESRAAFRIRHIDLETMTDVTPMGVGSVPGCTVRVVADEDGQTFVAAYTRNARWMVGRFDKQGNLLGESELDLPGRPATLQVRDMMIAPRLGYLIVLSAYDPPRDGAANRIQRLDLQTLQSQDQLDFDMEFAFDLMPFDSNRLLLKFELGQDARQFMMFDISTWESGTVVQTGPDASVGSTIFAGTRIPGTDEFLVGARGLSELLHVNSRAEIVGGRAAYEVDSAVIQTAPWQGQMIFAETVIGSWDARIGFYDPVAQRVLPRARRIGHGVVGRILTDERQRVWMLLPWSGELVRLTAAN